MFDIGASLKEAREKRGLSPEDVQKELRIRARYLTALEEERWELLPGDAYTKGFLRTYAEFLGLNGTLYIDEFNERFASHGEEALVPDSLSAGKGASRILFRTIAGVIAVAVVIAALMAFGSGSSTTANLPEPAAAAAATPRTVQVHGAIAHIRRYVAPRIPTALIRATKGRSWFSVRRGGANGREIFRGFLNRGHKLSYRLNADVWLRIGRPSAVTIRIGRYTLPSLAHTPANLLLTRNGARAG